MMPDGKALQGCTSHDLGQNFSKSFDWTVLDQLGKAINPHQNSWGLSTRSIGALILAHGDDNGLKLPPQIAPIQAVIVPIFKNNTQEKILSYCHEVKKTLNDFRVMLDTREGETAGSKFNKWELKGVPIRLEIGEKEVDSQTITLVRRDTGEKTNFKLAEATKELSRVFSLMQKQMFEIHKAFTEQNTRQAKSYDEFKQIMKTKRGFIRALWCENENCEQKIKQETKATTRCLPIDSKQSKGNCIYCGKPAAHEWLFAQAY
jgi:prolyl-tRNA synthetase